MKIVVRKSEPRKQERQQQPALDELAQPSLAEYAAAVADLRRAEKILRGAPSLLAGVAEECARWVPRFLDAETVRDALISAAWCARPHSFRIADLDRVVSEAIERGRKRPHLTRAERKRLRAGVRP